ncbi:hypothetical protein GAS19_24130 [Burkholderia glumae]|uniref:hypothetical protein n=1 Tax=Burkholderia glumae TaxID=337 RepID=UPI0012975C24|nr:hypothetical protein [Burkholderia glumae]QGA40578.1 hypothetical protein GAS19_24130 [Burkholderia glumae]
MSAAAVVPLVLIGPPPSCAAAGYPAARAPAGTAAAGRAAGSSRIGRTALAGPSGQGRGPRGGAARAPFEKPPTRLRGSL